MRLVCKDCFIMLVLSVTFGGACRFDGTSYSCSSRVFSLLSSSAWPLIPWNDMTQPARSEEDHGSTPCYAPACSCWKAALPSKPSKKVKSQKSKSWEPLSGRFVLLFLTSTTAPLSGDQDLSALHSQRRTSPKGPTAPCPPATVTDRILTLRPEDCSPGLFLLFNLLQHFRCWNNLSCVPPRAWCQVAKLPGGLHGAFAIALSGWAAPHGERVATFFSMLSWILKPKKTQCWSL